PARCVAGTTASKKKRRPAVPRSGSSAPGAAHAFPRRRNGSAPASRSVSRDGDCHSNREPARPAKPGIIIVESRPMSATPWIQIYDPLANAWLSTAAAALPIVLLLFTLGVLEWRAHVAALSGLAAAIGVSIVVYGMPAPLAGATAIYGAAYGLLPIGWIVINAVFLYNLTVTTGQFE